MHSIEQVLAPSDGEYRTRGPPSLATQALNRFSIADPMSAVGTGQQAVFSINNVRRSG
jgi:hypothetical protein